MSREGGWSGMGTDGEREEIEWLKLPHDLQERFFELAEEESRRIADSVRELAEELEGVRGLLRFDPLPRGGGDFTVAAVDGSRSPRLSERLGARYGVFSAGVLYLGRNGRREVFRAGTFKRRQIFSADRSKYLFDLLTVRAERELALRALGESDLVLVDGSFYGFMYSALKMREEGLMGEEDARLVEEIAGMTSELARSGRAVGIVKRSHTRVIGGYVATRDPGTRLKSILDKMILSYLMPPRTYLDYRGLIGDEHPQVYTNLARMIMEGRGGSDVMEAARRNVFRAFERLGVDSSSFSRLRRLQVRAHPGAPVCEVEFPADADLGHILEIMGGEGFFNEATNLPMALDLVDNEVELPTKFTDEFVGEVEGRALEMISRAGGDVDALRLFFSMMNPQKSV